MQNILHNYANRLESGGAIDHLPASEASPSATFWRAKRAQCCNATASVASMSLVMKLKRFNFFLKIFKILPHSYIKVQQKRHFTVFEVPQNTP